MILEITLTKKSHRAAAEAPTDPEDPGADPPPENGAPPGDPGRRRHGAPGAAPPAECGRSRKENSRCAFSEFQPSPGSKHKKKRVGRGPGSGWGKTAARGFKGQNSRAGGGAKGRVLKAARCP